MYLVNCDTLTLEYFVANPPPYAILSHTWGKDEITFAEFNGSPRCEDKAGFRKIKTTCEQALRDGFRFAWVDTCCINKDSSAELGEAINSMFQWYRKSAICYIYLQDFPDDVSVPIRDASVLKSCRWFSRGWTLQELLAPRNADFFGPSWRKVGTKSDLGEILEKITRIPQKVLRQETPLGEISVADRMSWAAGRRTTREEDTAYCLMGLFDVNMSMIYGEGRKAFLRLQDEILKQTQDDSLFAWQASEQTASEFPYRGLFASSPDEFASDTRITPFRTSMAGSTTVLGGGQVSLNCTVDQNGNDRKILGLKCFHGTDLSRVVSIEVVGSGAGTYLRARPSETILRPHQHKPVWEDIVLERFAEKGTAPLADDIFQNHGVSFSLPAQIKVAGIHGLAGAANETNIPLAFFLGQRVAVELLVDPVESGVEQFGSIGWTDKLGVKPRRIVIVLWAEPRLYPSGYEYHFSLERFTARDSTIQKLLDNQVFVALSHQQRASVGWAFVDVQGALHITGRRREFSVKVEFTINESLKAEANKEYKRQWEVEMYQRQKEDVCLTVLFAISIGLAYIIVQSSFSSLPKKLSAGETFVISFLLALMIVPVVVWTCLCVSGVVNDR